MSSAAAASYPESHGIWKGSSWAYHYAALPRIMARYATAEGLLWTNDDVAVNYWNLVKANKTKLWLPNNPRRSEYVFFDLYPKPGQEPEFDDWGSDPVYRQQAIDALGQIHPRYVRQYEESILPKAKTYHKRACDLFYIPQRYFEPLRTHLLPAFLKAQVVSEIAIPMIFMALDAPSKWDPILNDMRYSWEMLWGWDPYFDPRDHWRPTISAFHPWKVSTLEGKQGLARALRVRDPQVAQLFPELFGKKRVDWMRLLRMISSMYKVFDSRRRWGRLKDYFD